MIFESWHVSIERYRAGGDVHGGAARCASKRGTSQTSTHSLEGRKREERLGELRNVARHKRALTGWRGGRGRRGLVGVETWLKKKEHRTQGGRGGGGSECWAAPNHKTKTTRRV